jgi:hypothetical protein
LQLTTLVQQGPRIDNKSPNAEKDSTTQEYADNGCNSPALATSIVRRELTADIVAYQRGKTHHTQPAHRMTPVVWIVLGVGKVDAPEPKSLDIPLMPVIQVK